MYVRVRSVRGRVVCVGGDIPARLHRFVQKGTRDGFTVRGVVIGLRGNLVRDVLHRAFGFGLGLRRVEDLVSEGVVGGVRQLDLIRADALTVHAKNFVHVVAALGIQAVEIQITDILVDIFVHVTVTRADVQSFRREDGSVSRRARTERVPRKGGGAYGAERKDRHDQQTQDETDLFGFCQSVLFHFSP